jgi:hypothetical protein
VDFSTREFGEGGFVFGDVGNVLSWKCLCGVGNCWEVLWVVGGRSCLCFHDGAGFFFSSSLCFVDSELQ